MARCHTPLGFDAVPAQLVPAYDWALARTRASIHSGDFQPGVKLSIDSPAAELGGSRSPIRDAFGRLEREWLVTISSRVRRLTRSRRRTSAGWRSNH